MTSHVVPNSRAAFNRRALLAGGAAALTTAGVAALWPRTPEPVFIARNQRYDAAQLVQTIEDGLRATGVELDSLRGRRVLLKPNLVEPMRSSPQMTTHPLVVAATADVLRRVGASVVVGEGPGHMRDTEQALIESGMLDGLADAELEFVDLNYEEVAWHPNQGRRCKLPGFYFPRQVVEADLIVSLPKLKTHHWMGVTASLKNMYGVVPGSVYGWPKNVLHHNGIPETVFDINASIPPLISVVDAIDCMEGDGPIMGTLKHMGLVIVGANPTAVDATVCRLMRVDPREIPYLRLANQRLGPLAESRIVQRGESWAPLAQPFELMPHLDKIRAATLES